MNAVLVKVPVPAAQVFLLEQAAERRGLTLSEFLLRSAEAVTGGTSGPDAWLVLYRAGFTDKEIGRRLGWTNRAVQEQRRRLHLPANRLSRKATNMTDTKGSNLSTIKETAS